MVYKIFLEPIKNLSKVYAFLYFTFNCYIISITISSKLNGPHQLYFLVVSREKLRVWETLIKNKAKSHE